MPKQECRLEQRDVFLFQSLAGECDGFIAGIKFDFLSFRELQFRNCLDHVATVGEEFQIRVVILFGGITQLFVIKLRAASARNFEVGFRQVHIYLPVTQTLANRLITDKNRKLAVPREDYLLKAAIARGRVLSKREVAQRGNPEHPVLPIRTAMNPFLLVLLDRFP